MIDITDQMDPALAGRLRAEVAAMGRCPKHPSYPASCIACLSDQATRRHRWRVAGIVIVAVLACAAAALICILGACGAPPHAEAPTGAGRAPGVVLAACVSGGGYQLNEHATACQGMFVGTLESQCKSGWVPCTKNPLAPADCAQLPGFFAAARTVSTSCGDAVNVLLGCGEVGTIPPACSAGFARRVQCPGRQTDSNPFSCSGWQVANTDPRSGVLCCASR